MRWFTSDTHFGHRNIIRYCDRPFTDVNHMNEVLIRNWNERVAPDDTVYHLGDVALGPWEEWNGILTRLNGLKVLVIGNHDRIFKGMPLKQQTKFYDRYANWFDVIADHITNLPVAGKLVNLSHFPYDGDHTKEERYNEYRLPDNSKILIHGHTHYNSVVSRSKRGTLQVHVGTDAWNYRPVSEDEIRAVINSF